MGEYQLHEDTIKLPSEGKGYLDTEKFIHGHSVTVRPMFVEEQVMVKGLINSGNPYEMTRKILERVLVDPGHKDFDHNQLLISDILIIMWTMRFLTYGPTWQVEFNCENCGLRQDGAPNSSNLLVKDASEVEDYKTEELEYTLQCGKEKGQIVKYHLPRLIDEKNTQQMVEFAQKQKRVIGDPGSYREIVFLANLIDSIDGEPLVTSVKVSKIMKWSPMDMSDLSDAMFEADSGIMLNDCTYPCKACGHGNGLEVNVSPDFFRTPSRRSRVVRDESETDPIL